MKFCVKFGSVHFIAQNKTLILKLCATPKILPGPDWPPLQKNPSYAPGHDDSIVNTEVT